MANEQNLHPSEYQLSQDEAKKGGIKSGEARRRKKALKECLQLLMEKEVGKDKEGNSITGVEAMATKAMQAALKGDWKAWELVRDTSGQKPVEKVVVAEVEQSVIDEVEEMVKNEQSKQE